MLSINCIIRYVLMKYAWLLLAFVPCVVFAEDDIGRFSIESVRAIECDQGMGNRYSSAIFERIHARAPSAFEIVTGASSAKFTVRGTLTFHAENNADTKAVSKYVNELGGRYDVSISVVDDRSVKADTVYSDTFTDQRNLDASAVRIADRIAEYYKKIRDDARLAEIAAAQTAAPEKPAVSFRSLGIGASGSGGVGRYHSFNRYGAGLTLSPEIGVFDLVVKPSLLVQRQNAANRNVSRADSARVIMSFGYDLLHAGPVTVTPFAGYGLFYQNIRGTDAGAAKTRSYYNSLANLELSIACRLSEHTGIFCAPSFSVFFESSRRDMFADVSLGFKFLF